MMKNKKASIPVTVLVVLTVALCVFALISFSISSAKRTAEIKDINLIQKIYLIKNNLDSGYSNPNSLLDDFEKTSITPQKIVLEKQQLKPGFFNRIWTREKITKYQFSYSP